MRVVTAAVRIVYPQTSIHGGFTSYQPETAPWLSERSITPYRKDIRRPNICKIFLAMFAIRSYNSIYIVALDDRQLLQTLFIVTNTIKFILHPELLLHVVAGFRFLYFYT